ncbi:MAG: cytochrome c3 family protein [Candidatus Marinimicrobia bacterium]|nr:cytochrome c3 family protein [Candidatus Neomarinimicrobiota bacterium]
MQKQLKLITLLILAGGLLVIFSNSTFRMPGNQQNYEPIQPIEFSHRLHAGEMEVPCQYCHYGASQSRHAGIPATSVCMNCHKYVSATRDDLRLEEEQATTESRDIKPLTSLEIIKIYSAMGYDPQGNPVEGKAGKSVEWVKVHNIPDFVFFSHKPHITAGVDCADCHGDVASMERIKQTEDLSMGWCLDCHRKDHESLTAAPERTQLLLDCATCHY